MNHKKTFDACFCAINDFILKSSEIGNRITVCMTNIK